MFAEPLAGWREVAVRQTKTKLYWAVEMARLLDGCYACCEKIVVVCDNLNTHMKGTFHEAFEPERARQLVRRIEFRHTPRHGSWLNIAENGLSSLTSQSVSGRRFGDIDTLRDESGAWSSDVNDTQRGVEWHMKVGDARAKLDFVCLNAAEPQPRRLSKTSVLRPEWGCNRPQPGGERREAAVALRRQVYQPDRRCALLR
jgi:hypothetical protein